jgi:hypothetical protein
LENKARALIAGYHVNLLGLADFPAQLFLNRLILPYGIAEATAGLAYPGKRVLGARRCLSAIALFTTGGSFDLLNIRASLNHF